MGTDRVRAPRGDLRRRPVRDRPPGRPVRASSSRSTPSSPRSPTPVSPSTTSTGSPCSPAAASANLPGYANGNLYEVQDALRHHHDVAAGPGRGHEPAVLRAGAWRWPPARPATSSSGARSRRAARPATPAAGRPTARPSPTAEGPLAWLLPVGALSPVCQVAPYATRYMHEYGVTREQLAWIPVTQRAHAALNPDAVYRDPLTVDDYLASRMISTPMCLFDCDVPVDGATAIVVSAAETAADLRAPVRIEAMAGVVDGRPSWEQWEDMGRVGLRHRGRACGPAPICGPRDVDVAQLYDGFTIEVVWWLEALGFCGPGEAGDFVDGGHAHRARRRAAAQHLGRPALGRAAARRLRPHRRGRAPAAGRGRRPPGGRRRGRRRSPTWAATRPAPRC